MYIKKAQVKESAAYFLSSWVVPEGSLHQEIYRLLEVGDPLAKRRRDLNVRV